MKNNWRKEIKTTLNREFLFDEKFKTFHLLLFTIYDLHHIKLNIKMIIL